MPWYIAAAFTVYTGLLIWQAAHAIELRRQALHVATFLLVKFAVLLVALAYWDPGMCFWSKKLTWHAVAYAAAFLVGEALLNLRLALVEPDKRPKADDFVIAFTILTTVIAPSVVLVLAARVILLGQCAAI